MTTPEPILLTVGKAAKLLSLHKSTVMEIYTHVSSQSQREELERLSKTGD